VDFGSNSTLLQNLKKNGVFIKHLNKDAVYGEIRIFKNAHTRMKNALKIIHFTDYSEEKSFFEEMKKASLLNNPYIVKLLEIER
jgi:hypothetical protein